ncbi:MAG: SRPBCC family protein [Pseudomonadales bacterium]|nr:SRPBCC family protein [Pseudomonadales bacterium]
MAKTMQACEPVDIEFFQSGDVGISVTQVLPCSKEQLAESLAGDDSWLEWAKGLKRIVWHEKTTDMVGSTRRVEMVGGDAVEETFFKWDVDAGDIAFYVTETTMKGVHIFAERYQFNQVGDTTTLTWTVAIQASGFNGIVLNLLKPVLKMVFKGWLKNLAKTFN